MQQNFSLNFARSEQSMKQKEVHPALQSFLDGKIILINKPLKWTSFDAVKKVRILTRVSKVGHVLTMNNSLNLRFCHQQHNPPSLCLQMKNHSAAVTFLKEYFHQQ